jgi:hypothetical protein
MDEIRAQLVDLETHITTWVQVDLAASVFLPLVSLLQALAQRVEALENAQDESCKP